MTEPANQFESVGDASSLGSSDSCKLIDRARNGCDVALTELITSLQGYLLAIARHQVRPELRAKVGASDVVQNVLLQAKQNLDGFRGSSRQTLLAWLRRILTNEINAAQRRYFASQKRNLRKEIPLGNQSGPGHAITDKGRSPHSDAVFQEDTLRLRSALQALPVDYRKVVVLRNWEKLSFEDVGLRMERSTEAAKKLWSRAIRQLQRELRDEVESRE